jgi:hypothetical protein
MSNFLYFFMTKLCANANMAKKQAMLYTEREIFRVSERLLAS